MLLNKKSIWWFFQRSKSIKLLNVFSPYYCWQGIRFKDSYNVVKRLNQIKCGSLLHSSQNLHSHFIYYTFYEPSKNLSLTPLLSWCNTSNWLLCSQSAIRYYLCRWWYFHFHVIKKYPFVRFSRGNFHNVLNWCEWPFAGAARNKFDRPVGDAVPGQLAALLAAFVKLLFRL